MVTVVLLKVALMWTTARLTLRRVLRFLALATGRLLPVRVVPGVIRDGADEDVPVTLAAARAAAGPG